MAYTYADYEAQPTDKLRLARLRLYLAELQADVAANVSKDGTSIDRNTIQAAITECHARRRELEARVGRASSITLIRTA